MSFTDPSAEPIQPEEGQGGEEASGGSPWESYLTRFPEEVRDDAAEAFREMEANANKRFESHAEFRKQWEPFQETGIHKLPAGDVSWLVEFRQALDNPEVIRQWWEEYARENGLTPQQAEEVQAAAGLDDYAGYQDPVQQQLIEKLLEERMSPLSKQLEQISGRFEQQDQAQREAQQMAEANASVDRQVAAIEKEHGKLDDDQKKLLATLASAHVEADADHCIQLGWADMQRWQNKYEKDTLQGKLEQPAPAEAGGVPSVSPEQHKRIDDAGVKDAALAFLRNNNRT